MARLSDTDFVALAMGIPHAKFKLDPIELAALSKDKRVQERARKIVLWQTVRLTQGEDVGPAMRQLIGIWCREELRGARRGRPKSKSKEEAIYSAFKAMTNDSKGQNLQRKAIISSLAEKFGVKERRVYEALERQDPHKQMEQLRKGWGQLLHRTTFGAENREMVEGILKKLDQLRDCI
jgi:hypothetical protein